MTTISKRKMTAFRLPHQTIADLDLLTAALQRRSPGKVSQADAVAWSVSRALAEVVEAEKAEERKREAAARKARALEQAAAFGVPLQSQDRTVLVTHLEPERRGVPYHAPDPSWFEPHVRADKDEDSNPPAI